MEHTLARSCMPCKCAHRISFCICTRRHIIYPAKSGIHRFHTRVAHHSCNDHKSDAVHVFIMRRADTRSPASCCSRKILQLLPSLRREIFAAARVVSQSFAFKAQFLPFLWRALKCKLTTGNVLYGSPSAMHARGFIRVGNIKFEH